MFEKPEKATVSPEEAEIEKALMESEQEAAGDFPKVEEDPKNIQIHFKK